jgi:hypothetical protein
VRTIDGFYKCIILKLRHSAPSLMLTTSIFPAVYYLEFYLVTFHSHHYKSTKILDASQPSNYASQLSDYCVRQEILICRNCAFFLRYGVDPGIRELRALRVSVIYQYCSMFWVKSVLVCVSFSQKFGISNQLTNKISN